MTLFCNERPLVLAAVVGLLLSACAPVDSDIDRKHEVGRLMDFVGVDPSAPIVLDSIPVCVGCAVEVTRRLTLRLQDEDQFFALLPWVLQDSRVRYLAASHNSARFEPLFVFDSAGALERSIGRHGRGPDEISTTGEFVLGLGDTLFVNADGRRINVYAPDRVPVRETILTFSNNNCESSYGGQVLPLPDGRLLLGVGAATSATSDSSLFLSDVNGMLLFAFGTPSTTQPGWTCRSLARDTSRGGVWVAEPRGYRLELLQIPEPGEPMQILRSIGVVAPWFMDGQRPFMTAEESSASVAKYGIRYIDPPKERPIRLTSPPSSGLRNMFVDAEGTRLWLAWQVPAAHWDTVPLRYTYPEESMLGDELNDALWTTVVDVIGSRRNVLLLRQPFPFYAQLAAPGVLAHSYYSSAGEPEVDIWGIARRVPLPQ